MNTILDFTKITVNVKDVAECYEDFLENALLDYCEINADDIEAVNPKEVFVAVAKYWIERYDN